MAGRIPLEELARLPSFHFPTLSWKRDRVAFYWDRTGRLELYVLDLQDRSVRRVSNGQIPRSVRAGFIWTRDDRKILFAKDRDGDEQHDIWEIDVESGGVRPIAEEPGSQEFPVEVSPDNRWLTVLSNRNGQMNLFTMRRDGSRCRQLTNYPNPVLGGGRWSPDGTRIAYVVNETPDLNNLDIYLCDAEGRGHRRLLQVRVGSHDRIAEWSPDGRSLAVTSDATGVNRPGIVDVDSGRVRWLGEPGTDETAVAFSSRGDRLVCLRNRDAQIRPVLYDVRTGEGRVLDLPAGVAAGSDLVRDDRALLALLSRPARRPELVLYDLETGATEPLLPAEYGSIDPSWFVDCEHIHYPSPDGLRIPALLYRPRRIPSGRKLPAVVIVHGGPTGQWFRMFDPYAQSLVDRGYVVLQPNPRGSTGYGVEFRDMNRFDWGGGDLEDIAAGAEFLKGLPYVDPERLAVCGGSYGGYMTFMQVVRKPRLWKAASAWVGVTDLHRLYESSMEHFKYYFRLQMGDPEEKAELWRERSPIEYADRLRAKLQIIHGVNDPRCPVEQSRIFRDRLVQLGRKEGEDFEYIEYGDLGHGSTDIEHRIRWYTALVDFLERNL